MKSKPHLGIENRINKSTPYIVLPDVSVFFIEFTSERTWQEQNRGEEKRRENKWI